MPQFLELVLYGGGAVIALLCAVALRTPDQAPDSDVTPWGDFPQIPPGFPLAGGSTGRGADGSGVAALSQDHVHNGGGNAS
jgi:hypothetical protein